MGDAMSKNSPEGNRERQKRRRQRQAAAGFKAVTVTVPEAAKPLLQKAARLMNEGEDPASALRRAGGGNEPPTHAPVRYQPWRDSDLAEMLERQRTDELQIRLADLELQSAAQFGRTARSLRGWRGILVRLAGLK